jgi:hypothetical protein
MPHQNSVLHGLLKLVPWSSFDTLVDEHQADARVRRLSTKSQLVALLYSQFSGAASLREIEAALASHDNRLYHLGARPVSRSTLADANASRPWQPFQKLFEQMAAQAARQSRRALGDAVRLIDATGLRLAGLGAEWARYSAGVLGAKAHVVYDPDADRPLYLQITDARVNDITPAKAMPIDPGATYVFDLGYYDYAWWAKLDAAGCRIVSRLKVNTPLSQVVDLPLDGQNPDIVSDQIGLLPARQAFRRNNPMQDPIRVVCLAIDDGVDKNGQPKKKLLRIFSNDLDASAQEICDFYKRRWAVELFFRAIKQGLRVKHLIGKSENAVRIQIAVALIAYLILRQAQDLSKPISSFVTFTRLIKANLMHRKDFTRLLAHTPSTPQDARQTELDWGWA